VKTIKDAILAVALCTLILNLTGCGGNGDRPVLGQVTGIVTLDNEPLTGTVVVFHPDDGRPARGKTDEDGKYELTYIGQTLGSKVGHNRVEIAPSEEREDDDEIEDTRNTENVGAAKRSKRGKIQVPARYNTKSELEADVQPGKNVFDFKLNSK
jgi:hypothetical protein